METVIDIECTSYNGDPAPYVPQNYLVSVGAMTSDAMTTMYWCVKHNERVPTLDLEDQLQALLNGTDVLIGHNIKFDLSWLRECGFRYEGKIYDTMAQEYIKAGGQPGVRLDLSSCCRRRGLPVKHDEAGEYFKQGIGFEAMPWDIVEEYGRNDVDITMQLYKAQQEELNGN